MKLSTLEFMIVAFSAFATRPATRFLPVITPAEVKLKNFVATDTNLTLSIVSPDIEPTTPPTLTLFEFDVKSRESAVIVLIVPPVERPTIPPRFPN